MEDDFENRVHEITARDEFISSTLRTSSFFYFFVVFRAAIKIETESGGPSIWFVRIKSVMFEDIEFYTQKRHKKQSCVQKKILKFAYSKIAM